MMPRCAEKFETLSAFVDGQLEPHEELEIRRHLDGCENCRSIVDSLIGLKEAVASTVEVHPVPHSLREQINEIAARPRRRSLSGLALWIPAIAAALFVFAIGAYWLVRSGATSSDTLTRALVDDHIRYLDAPDAIQVASSDPRRVADSFRDRVGFPVRLPDLKNANLLGGRFCWLKGHRAVLAFYRLEGRPFSLFVLGRDAVSAGEKTQCRQTKGYAVCLIPARNELLAMVADQRQATKVFPELTGIGRRKIGAAPED